MITKKYSDLLKIGFTEGESKVYAALLELGPSTVGPLLKRAHVAHSNIYEILDRLITKGIVTIITKSKTKVFQAVSPSNLTKYLDRKEEDLTKQRKILKKALPRIEALQKTYPRQEAMLFIGLDGLRTAYEELFANKKKGDENLWIYVHDKKFSHLTEKFYLHMWMDLAKGIKARGIANEEYRQYPFAKAFQRKYNMRFANFPLFSHGEVFKDKFLLISWEDPIISVLVQAKHVSDNFKKYFESVWKASKP
jgi:HTH-type transcriptional regulator, sugar sensing transcriptional regulator